MGVLNITKTTATDNERLAKNIANDKEKADMKPIIMRDGILGDWNEIRTTINQASPLKFKVFKNHATDIEGYIIFDGKKFPLFLMLGLPDINNKILYDSKSPSILKMGWAAPDTFLIAIPDWDKGVKTNEDNQIKLIYKDIGTTSYCLIENQNFSSTISKCN